MGAVIGVGIDLAEIPRFSRMARRPDWVLGQVFTPAELARSRAAAHRATYLAASFVVKEAVFKALGQGWLDGPLFWLDVELLTPLAGVAPRVALHGAAGERFRALGGRRIVTSLSWQGRWVLGQVLLLGA